MRMLLVYTLSFQFKHINLEHEVFNFSITPVQEPGLWEEIQSNIGLRPGARNGYTPALRSPTCSS